MRRPKFRKVHSRTCSEFCDRKNKKLDSEITASIMLKASKIKG